ncbi:hypothetical protein ABFS82_13G108400 [Erythranthe guttata]|uniref:Glycine-rich protein n=1 Tax=Erythranthe guttata TaxID=4155 RepID=A0A022QL52_ERYGU|nr:PREDICTED: glycine-rich cell wall structural protein-like [Erythranthe guttata]EYU27958.1 hypothetical protein MIMGU_mgv1a015744mg [Erythranthe guttata]|eukprot:XP_012849065.1 PREDICTED: glycine-rich cell wall structural protein-like [Erythranthe guttata]
MKSTSLTIILSFLLFSAAVSFAVRPEPESETRQPASKKGGGGNDNSGGGFNIPGFGSGGGGFNIPGFGPVIGGGYGSGYGSPSGGRSKNGVVRSTVVCKDKGPCYKKKLTCPAKCFTSYSRSGKGYGYGGGGGGCTMDCQKKCIAYC